MITKNVLKKDVVVLGCGNVVEDRLMNNFKVPGLTATTADLESKCLDEGPKLVKAFFAAARE